MSEERKRSLLAEISEIKHDYFIRGTITREDYITLVDAWWVKMRRHRGVTSRRLPQGRRVRRSIEWLRKKYIP